MKLYVEDGETFPAYRWLDDADPQPQGFTESTDPVDWNIAAGTYPGEYVQFRNEVITKFEPSWGSYSDDQKRALIANYVWPSETSNEDLDAILPESDREELKFKAMRSIRSGVIALPVMSKDSSKFFAVTISDLGMPQPVEITTDAVIDIGV